MEMMKNSFNIDGLIEEVERKLKTSTGNEIAFTSSEVLQIIGVLHLYREELKRGAALEDQHQENLPSPGETWLKGHYQKLIELASDAIFLARADTGIIVEANQKAREMLGLSLEEIRGMHHSELHPPERREEYKKCFIEYTKKNAPPYSDVHVIDSQGRWIPLEASSKLIDLWGESFVLGIFREITLRKKNQENLEKKLLATLEEVSRLKNLLEAENIFLHEEIDSHQNFGEIVGHSPVIKRVLARVERVAPTSATVLILGETGVGKELIAQAIYQNSLLREKPFIKLNCAILSGSLVESELFGHEKGAFTGAHTTRIGRFEMAHGGTLFLDEVESLPLETQAKILRVLQDGEFERLGSSQTQRVKVRILCATNGNLLECIEEGTFRKDLYYRLNVFPLEIPPLRDRREDIPLLAKFFTSKYAARMSKVIEEISTKMMEALVEYHWPGNIRELENYIERAVILCQGKRLQMVEGLVLSTPVLPGPTTLDEVMKNHILTVLNSTRDQISGKGGAAQILGINPSTLRSRMKSLGIDPKKS